ncbi:hypothetical protein ACFXAZ_33335 [Streptomyces sp. NPDC059477]|uniref:hypothetical protein n=1 Tax=Streptomyces sp. NPDC059477 TaxID=3346847 RepID=UPI00369AC312
MDPEHYHLLLAVDGEPVQHGWWADETTARQKAVAWIGEYGGRPGARITLVDEATGETLTDWPTEA